MNQSETGTIQHLPAGGHEYPPVAEHSPPSEQRGGRLLRRTTTVSLFTGLSVVVGFLVDVLIVSRYGVGVETDAFFGAYTVPLALITTLTAIQPVLVTILAAHRDEQTVFAVLLNTTGLLAVFMAAVGVLLARPLVNVTIPGFAPPVSDQAAHLARILFARLPAAAVAEVCKAELYTRRRFGLATFSDALPSLVTVVPLVAIGRAESGAGIEIVAFAFVAGALAQAALLVIVLFGQLRVPYRGTLHHPTPVLRQAGRLVLAPLAGLLLRQGVTLAERIFGSFLAPGSVTVLSYANRLTMIVAGVFFDALTKAALPSLATSWSHGQARAARGELLTLLKLMGTISLPVGLAIAALSAPLVRLLFQRGPVDDQAALLMGTVLGVYALSLPFLGPYRAVRTFFFAVKETWPLVVLHGGLAALTVALDLALVWRLGVVGLALAYALSCGMIVAAGMVWLAQRVGDLGWQPLADWFWRLGLTSLAMGVVLLGLGRWLGTVTREFGRWGDLLTLGLSGLAGLAVFASVGALVRLEAISILWSLARRRWRTGT